MQDRRDKHIVNAFVEHLRDHGHPELSIDGYPDEVNRNSNDIDAIAFPFAIEHTSIDTLQHQRRNQVWFGQFADPLREALEGEVPFYLNVMFGYDSLKRGVRIDDVRGAFERWVRDESHLLRQGRSTVSSAKGIPFTFEAERKDDWPPGLILTRLAPTDGALADRIRSIVERKADKLQRYHSNYTTVLLIENGDRSLMNKEKMLGALHRIYPDGPPTGVDQIWYADTSNPTRHWFIHVTPYLKRANHSMFGY
ncbi:MAG: hypothetical protein AB7G28_02340 [Pirellulales bacterium]